MNIKTISIDDIVQSLIQYNKAYRLGKPLVADYVYDQLKDKLPKGHPYLNEVEPEPLYKNHVKHEFPLLSMQKAKTNEEMLSWLHKVRKTAVVNNITVSDVNIKATQKLDGIAGVYNHYKFATRGDGIEGNDVTDCLAKGIVLSMPKDDMGRPILGEFIVRLKYFENHLSEDFSHPRNFVSGAIMSDTVNKVTSEAFNEGVIVFQAYSELPNINVKLDYTIETFRHIERMVNDFGQYKCDGVIFEVVHQELKKIMGETESFPNWAIALKPKDTSFISIVTGIEWATGRTGRVTPTIIMKPIMIDGVEVRRASGHNARMIIDMGIAVGKKIEVIRSGSVIPYIVGVIE